MQYLDPKKELTASEPRRNRPDRMMPSPAPFLPLEPAPVAASGATFQDFLRILRRHQLKLLAFIGFAVIAAVVVQFTVPKLYEASAMVKIDRRMASIDTAPQSSSAPADDMDPIITTEMELAQSDTVLRPIAERYNLLEVEKQLKGLSASESQKRREAPIKLNELKIKRPPNTYLIDITYRAHDPKLAADVANAIALSLGQHSNDTSRRTLTETSAAVAQNLAELRAKMEQSDTQLAAFETQLGITDPDQRATVLSARLKDLTSDLTSAQSDRAGREATMHQMQLPASLPPQQALAAAQVADSLGAPNQSGISEEVMRLNEALAAFASAKSYYGTAHPEYTRAHEQVLELQSQIIGMVKDAAERTKVAYRQSIDRENNLHALVNSTKTELDNMDANATHYEQLREEAANDRKFYSDLSNRARIADINNSFDNDSVRLFASARPPQEHIFPRLIVDLPLALVLASLLGVIAAVISEALDTKLSDADEVASRLQVDVLAVVPDTKRLPPIIGIAASNLLPAETSVRTEKQLARYKEAFSTLRTSVSLSILDSWMKTVQVTSSTAGEGKTSTAARLAVSYAQVGKKVLLLDADMRRPTTHRVFGVSSTPGLSDVLEGDSDYHEAIIATGQPGLFLMPAGPVSRRSSELITLHFASVLAKVSRDFDLVVVDSPPMHGASESAEIAQIADGVIVVVNASKTPGSLVASTVGIVRRARAQLIGIVMNRARGFGDTYSYTYTYEAQIDRESIPVTQG